MGKVEKPSLLNKINRQMKALSYLVEVNCKGVKKGTIAESKAESFEVAMIAKYSNGGKNLVTVLFR